MPLLKPRSDSALDALLRLYHARNDLQEVFPEVEDGDQRRLIDWAAGAATGSFVDSAYSVLHPYARWYKKRFTGTIANPPVPWSKVKLGSERAANPLSFTLQTQQSGAADDISHHLVTLALLVIELGLKQIVELGTRSGNSTLALLEAARQIKGNVLSIDIDECRDTRQKVAAAGLSDWWRFIQQGDLDVADAQLPSQIDLLFIDTNHLYDHTMAELRKYAPLVRPGGWIAFHDYVSFAGVTRAVTQLVASLSHRPRFYPYVHQNGLALVRLAVAHGEPHPATDHTDAHG